MPHQRNIDCTLLVNGVAAPEYGLKDLGNSKYEVHVAVVDDAYYSFSINFGNTGADRHEMWLEADGQKIHGQTSTSKQMVVDRSNTSYIDGYHKFYRLKFGQLEIGKINSALSVSDPLGSWPFKLS